MPEEPTDSCRPGKAPVCVERVSIAAVFLLALLLRLPGLGRPAWIDEVITLEWAARPYAEIFAGNITPFMTATARTMLLLFGSEAMADEMTVRLPHLVFGMAGIFALYVFLRRAFGFLPALAAALFLATLPRHAAYSQEARYYAFAMLAQTGLIAAVFMTVRRFRPAALALVFASTALGIFNHLSFVFALAALAGVGGVLLLLKKDAPRPVRLRRAALFGLVCAAGVGAALTPSLAYSESGRFQKVLGMLHLTGDAPLSDALADDMAEEDAPSPNPKFRLEWGAYWGDYLPYHYLGARRAAVFYPSLLLAVGGLLWLLFHHRALALMLGALMLVHTPFFFIDAGHTWSPRYFVVQIVALAMLSGFGVAGLAGRFQRRRAAAFGVALLYAVFLCLGRAPAYELRHSSHTDLGMKEVARTLAREALPRDTIAIVGAQWGWRPSRVLKYYLGRELAQNPSLWSGLAFADCRELADLDRTLAARAPNANVWVLSQGAEKWPAGVAQLAQGPAETVADAGLSLLWVYGCGTVNLLGGGDFEEPLDGLEMPKEGVLVSGDEAYGGGRSFRADVSPDTDVEKRPMPTVWFSPVRDPQGNPGPAVLEDGVTYSLSLRLKCADLLPGKFPSRVLRVMVSGREPSGKSYFGDFLRISGTHDWRRYEVQLVPGLNLPSGLRDIKVGVGNRGGSGTFWVDNLQLEKQPRTTPFTRSARTDPSGGGG